MKVNIYYKGEGNEGELIQDNYFDEYILIDLDVVSHDCKNQKTHINKMNICLLSLDALKEKWAKNPNAKNSVCVSGNVFTLNPLSGTNLVVKNLNKISIEAISDLLKNALKDKKFSSLFDLRLALFPIIKCVYMDNVDESLMTFYECAMDPKHNRALPLQWSIVCIEKIKHNQSIVISDLTEVDTIQSDERLKLTIEIIMPSGRNYQAEISFVGMNYFLSSCDNFFETSSNTFHLNTSLHVVTTFSQEVITHFMKYIFGKLSGASEKELLLKLNAFLKINTTDTNQLFTNNQEVIKLGRITFRK